MNPFDLSGPQFLIFYTILLLASGIVVYLYWLTLGASGQVQRPLTDPYLIAYLRGGAKEAVKIAAATLTHRRAATVAGDTITTDTGQMAGAKNELDKTILEECQSGSTLWQLADGRAADVAKRLFHNRLTHDGLILSDSESQSALVVRIILIASLMSIAVTKIFIALGRGRDNIWFLIILAALGVLAHAKLSLWRTPRGSEALKDLRVLFGRLKNKTSQLTQVSQNNQFAFLIAVFGVAVLPSTEYLFASAFKPKQGSNSGCGSSCGSSGCGGGGCGGGCGGCGS